MRIHDCHFYRGTRSGIRKEAAVTVLELLVAVTLLSFIILALYQMFDRTQEQLRRAMAQVDTLENGRAIMDMMQRDLGKITPPPFESTNFTYYRQEYIGDLNGVTLQFLNANGSATNVFTNSLDRFLFLINDQSLRPTNWGAVGYHIGHRLDPAMQPTNGIGTLYRYAFNSATPKLLTNLSQIFFMRQSTQAMARVADNIVHFRVRGYPTHNVFSNVVTDREWEPPYSVIDRPTYFSTNRTLPSLVEVELGYVDEETAGIVEGFGSQDAATNYLAQIPQKVNLFRFLVPVKTLR